MSVLAQLYFVKSTVKPDLNRHSQKDQKLDLKTNYRLMQVKRIAQKNCRMLPLEHSAILLTCIKLPFAIKILVLSILKWPLKTGFTVPLFNRLAHMST